MALTATESVNAGPFVPYEADVDVFATEAVANYCGVPMSCPTGTGGGDCSGHRTCAAAHLCVANSLMRILQSPSAWLFTAHPGGTKTDYQVPPQDQPTNVALAEVAAEYADLAATHVDLGITACNTAGTLDECADGTPASPTACPNPTDENTVAASLAATWVEAFNLRIEAAEEMHDASLAVADGAYAENSAIADAAALGLTADHVSRGHAAHGWIGGASNLPTLIGRGRGAG